MNTATAVATVDVAPTLTVLYSVIYWLAVSYCGHKHLCGHLYSLLY